MLSSKCSYIFQIFVFLIKYFTTRLTRWVPLIDQELLTFTEHLSSPPVFSGVRVTRSLVVCVCFVDRCLSFSLFSFGHCIVCPFSIYGFWFPLWYLQTLLIIHDYISCYNVYDEQNILGYRLILRGIRLMNGLQTIGKSMSHYDINNTITPTEVYLDH